MEMNLLKGWETLEDLKCTYKLIASAFKKPVLDMNNWPNEWHSDDVFENPKSNAELFVNNIIKNEKNFGAEKLAFTLAAAWTLKAGAHVRVDVFYRSASPRMRGIVDLLGTLFLLLPMAGLILWISVPYAMRAWAIFERSQETSGLPLVFLLKSAIPLFAVLVIMQGVAEAARAAVAIFGAAKRER
jgi:TRAP-type mannitol/chloroaromatic compound transport system permease small subunit